MATGGFSDNANLVGVEVVNVGFGSDPADGGFDVVDLGGKGGFVAVAVGGANDSVAVAADELSGAVSFGVFFPAAAVNVHDDRQRPGLWLLGLIEIERE